jgi:hypothetical protein
MKRAREIAFAVVVLTGFLLLGASFFYRVVRTPWGTVLLERPRPAFGGAYVDTRHWEARDFIRNWELSKQLMQRGLQNLPTSPIGPAETGAAVKPKRPAQSEKK